MKTFLEEYGVIIVASIAVLALVAIATTASDILSEEIVGVIDTFTGQIAQIPVE